jgi:preprotein translocase subunit YajC
MLSVLTYLLIFAEGEGQKQPEPFGGSNLIFLLPILLLAFWLLVLRPSQKRQERDRQALVNNMNKNDKVITNAGVIGTVHSIHDDEVVLKLEDAAKMRILKSTIFRNVSSEERQKAAAPGAAATSSKPEEAAKEQKA